MFLFFGGPEPVVLKYDGSNFQSHSGVTLTAPAIGSPKAAFRNPYFIHPEANGDGDINLKFFEYNSNTDQWDVAFQRAYSGKTQFITAFDVSIDHKFIAICFGSDVIVEEGSIAGGYTEKQTLTEVAFGMKFSPINDLLFIPQVTGSSFAMYINCNWNTSGNFYFNSNTSTCQ